MAKCEHDDISWRSATPKREALNEAAWQCVVCDEWLGFRPDLDRSHIERKVFDILMDLHESKLLYISNGTMGEIVAENVAAVCRERNRYDQKSILRLILNDPNVNHDDGQFWSNRAERWLMGGEPIREGQEALPFSA